LYFLSLALHFDGNLSFLMYIFLSEINGAFDSFDVFVSPIQMLAFCLDFLKFINHDLPLLNSFIDSCLEL